MKGGSEDWNEERCKALEDRLLRSDESQLRFYVRSKTLTRYLNWEFWPQKLIYIPVYVMDYILGITHLDPLYFTNANPCMTYGGMYDCSKSEICKLLPPNKQAEFLAIKKGSDPKDSVKRILEQNWSYPIVLKPDKGDRGVLVRKCGDEEDVAKYFQTADFDVLAQEFVDARMEFGIFCLRDPNADRFRITSVTFKKRMHVVGDGWHSIRELLEEHPRLRIFLGNIERRMGTEQLHYVPKRTEEIEVVRFGNHSKGSMFLNVAELLGSPLQNTMDDLCSRIEGFNYGRFDILTDSIQDLLHGRFHIIELNGAMAEPTHIYDPMYPLWRGIKDLMWHHKKLFDIGHGLGHEGPNHGGLGPAIRDLRAFRSWESKIKLKD